MAILIVYGEGRGIQFIGRKSNLQKSKTPGSKNCGEMIV